MSGDMCRMMHAVSCLMRLGAACFVMSAHEPVAIITQWVGPALHGDTIPWGGVPPDWQNLEPEHIYIYIHKLIFRYRLHHNMFC